MDLYLMYKLSVSAVLLCILSAVVQGYEEQMIVDCEYDNNIKDVVYFVRNTFNQKLNTLYDSRVGKYVGFGEYGMINAAHFNSQAWKMAMRKVEVETICRYNAQFYKRISLDRKVPPTVTVQLTKPAQYGERATLVCSILGFYPQKVMVNWLRDGVEMTSDVSSTDIRANGDWSYQLHSYLELVPKRGERVGCMVHHISLNEPIMVDWDSSELEAKELKKLIGIFFFFIGVAVTFGGALYYWWRLRSLRSTSCDDSSMSSVRLE